MAVNAAGASAKGNGSEIVDRICFVERRTVTDGAVAAARMPCGASCEAVVSDIVAGVAIIFVDYGDQVSGS